jgi:hypothetical protein
VDKGRVLFAREGQGSFVDISTPHPRRRETVAPCRLTLSARKREAEGHHRNHTPSLGPFRRKLTLRSLSESRNCVITTPRILHRHAKPEWGADTLKGPSTYRRIVARPRTNLGRKISLYVALSDGPAIRRRAGPVFRCGPVVREGARLVFRSPNVTDGAMDVSRNGWRVQGGPGEAGTGSKRFRAGIGPGQCSHLFWRDSS